MKRNVCYLLFSPVCSSNQKAPLASANGPARSVTQLYDHHLRAGGVESTQFALLSIVEGLGPSSQATIGRALGLEKTTLSRNLKWLKTRGWIETTAADDARERRYVLSKAGAKRLDLAKPAWRRAQSHLRSSMSVKDWEAMWKAFRIVTEAAQTAHRTVRS